MFNKENIIIGLLSILIIIGGISLFSRNGNIGAYEESYTNFTNLKATDAFKSEGATTLSGTVSINQSTTTTLAVGGTGKTGCIAMGDSASSTLITYLTITGSTVSATTTKPAICK